MYRNLSTVGLGISGVESEIIELALTFKFQSIDPDFTDMQLRLKEKGVDYARRLIASAKMRMGTFALPISWDGDDNAFRRELDKLKVVGEQAQQLGSLRTVVTLTPAADERPYHENFEFHRRRLAEVGKALSPFGLSLGVDFRAPAGLRAGRAFEFIHTFDELRKLINAVAQENVGVVVDAWELYAGGGSLDQLSGLTNREVVAVSLADAPEDVPREQLTEKLRLLPGETSVVDNAGVIRWLVEIGYEGPVTARPDRSRFPKTGRLQIVRQIAEALDQTWIAAELEPLLANMPEIIV